jgi:hypothetical protein
MPSLVIRFLFLGKTLTGQTRCDEFIELKWRKQAGVIHEVMMDVIEVGVRDCQSVSHNHSHSQISHPKRIKS